MNPSPSFWRGRRVLLTGHTGFKGAWASLWLERLGARVTGFSRAPETEPNLIGLAWPGIDGRIGDLVDPTAVRAAVEAADPEIVLHMGAQALVRRSYADPVDTFATNVMGTVHLLDALRGRAALQAVLVVTSDKTYAHGAEHRPFVEGDALGGADPYSASKACAEHVAASWAASFWRDGPALATARAGNVVGGGDWAADRLIPDIWRARRAGTPLVLRHPQATRPWQHVLDALAGYLVYVERLAAPGGAALPRALNFGPRAGERLTVAEVVEAVERALGGETRGWRLDDGPIPPEAPALALDASRAKAVLGWTARLDMARALAFTADWYGRHAAGAEPRALCLEQIAAFEALAG
jgi:CDP-glucose 4,6-dehydratase